MHKFDLVTRLPLALGLAHALAQARRLGSRVPVARDLVPVVAACCLVVLVAPAALIGVAQRGAFTEVPDWWRQTARYLADQPVGGRTLVLPGASFADSYWGDPRDEPLQPLATSPWIVRDGVPLGSGGATRLLTRVEQVVQSGHGGAELAGLLSELDVTRVVQRADLDWRATAAPPPLVVRQALRSTPGLAPVRTFGPLVGGSARADVAAADGLDQPVPTIEVWTTGQPARTTRLTPVADVTVTSGGTEQPSGTSVLAADPESVAALRAAGGATSGTVTDTLQRREATFAAVRDAWSPVLPAATPYPAQRAGHDWFPARLEHVAPSAQTTLAMNGVAAVAASSSRAEPVLGGVRDLSASASAALDGDGSTAWVSARPATGEGWDVQLLRPVQLGATLDVVLDEVTGADVTGVEVVTDAGRTTTRLTPAPRATSGSPTGLDAPARQRLVQLRAVPGLTSRVALRATGVRTAPGLPFAVVEVGPALSRPPDRSWSSRLPPARRGW